MQSIGLIRYVGEENDGLKVYEFIFTDNTDEFWGEGFEHVPASLVRDIKPSEKYITKIEKIKTKLTLDLVQDNSCFGMQDALDNIVAIAWESIRGYDEYPDDGRLVIMFGESYEDVEVKLAEKGILFERFSDEKE